MIAQITPEKGFAWDQIFMWSSTIYIILIIGVIVATLQYFKNKKP